MKSETSNSLGYRIRVVFMARTMSRHPHGAYAWFGRLVKVRPRSVRRWVDGDYDPAGSDKGRAALKKLTSLERGFADAMALARVRLDSYDTDRPRTAGEWEAFGQTEATK